MFKSDKTVLILRDFFVKNRNVFLLLAAVFISSFNAFFWSAPKSFPIGSIYDLKAGQTISVVSRNFIDAKITRSDFWLKSFVYVFTFGKEKVVEGDYALYKRQNVIALAWRISHGAFDISPLKITIPEGLDSSEIADIFAKNTPSFDKQKFLDQVISQNLEGYLFPDTYLFMPM